MSCRRNSLSSRIEDELSSLRRAQKPTKHDRVTVRLDDFRMLSRAFLRENAAG